MSAIISSGSENTDNSRNLLRSPAYVEVAWDSNEMRDDDLVNNERNGLGEVDIILIHTRHKTKVGLQLEKT